MRFATCLVLAGLFLASTAQGHDGVFLSSAYCIMGWTQIPLFQPITIEVMAQSDDGFTVAEFALTGFSGSSLFVTFTPNPDATEATGDPAAGGARIVFGSCQSGRVLLWTATVFAAGPVTPTFGLAAPASPIDPQVTCPNLTRCDGTTKVCLATGPLYAEQVIDGPSSPYPADGAVDMDVDVPLSFYWSGGCTCQSTPCFGLWFGTDPDPPFFGSGCMGDPLPQPGILEPSTQYYWRVQVDFCAISDGPVWSFTTTRPIGVVGRTSWGNIKQLFR